MRWFAGVPLGTNPLTLINTACGLVALWFLAVLFIVLVQSVVGGELPAAALHGAMRMALYLTGYTALAFAVIVFVVFRNRYAVLYRFAKRSAFCSTMRGSIRALKSGFHWRPYPIHPLTDPARSVEKTVPWTEVRAVQGMDAMRRITLMGERGCLMRVHCPDRATYDAALAFAHARMAQSPAEHLPNNVQTFPQGTTAKD